MSMAASQQVLDAISTDHLHADLKGRSVRGGFWTLGSQGAQFLLQTVSTVVLARLLTPADFGIVAMVMAITSLGQAFADLDSRKRRSSARKSATSKSALCSGLMWRLA